MRCDAGAMAGAEGPEAAMAAAQASFAAGDFDGVLGNLSAAIRGFTAADRPREAAMACAPLGDAMTIAGNAAAGRARQTRAMRLGAELEPCIEQGWVAVAPMGCYVDDPDELLRNAELAVDRARRFGVLELEAKALADGGLALVQAGEVEAGMARLDEAMALACGPVDPCVATGQSVCSLFTACYYAADYARFETWSEALRRTRLLAPEPGTGAFLIGHCESVRAALLIELGRWSEAEEVLTKAIVEF